mmetsp:Transcript_45934/g.58998  ORF Transcript_45934/g.58998 Transcript_45934/m.58998 type:complete len:226 (-) Transcript_45934:425-1102(-)
MASLSNMEGDLDPRVTKVKAQYEKTLLKVLEEKEKAMDEQMKNLENMDEDDFERLREKRKLQLQKLAVIREKNIRNGHGRYMELSDQKEFFEASKVSKNVVVHFFRGATWRCDVINRHFSDLAPVHLETRFVKIDAEKSPFLVERLGIVMLPSILCIKDGKTVHTIAGFDEFGVRLNTPPLPRHMLSIYILVASFDMRPYIYVSSFYYSTSLRLKKYIYILPIIT